MPAENSVVKCRWNEHVTSERTEESEPHKEMEDLAADEVICLDEKFPKQGPAAGQPKTPSSRRPFKRKNLFFFVLL